MQLIDENGNLFGVVNVIDALAVVLLIAVIAAGVVIVTGLTGGETETRYATIELGQQPDYVIDRIDEGDVATFDSGNDVTVTDVYVTPVATTAGDNETIQSHVTIRAEVNGELHENDRGGNEFRVGGEAFRPGNEFELNTDSYVVSGTVTDLEQENASLPVNETPILLETTVSDMTAAEMDEGDTMEIGPYTVATVTSVQLYPVEEDQQGALVGINLVTLEQGSSPSFGNQATTIDRQLLLRMGDYELNGQIRRGANTLAGETNTTTVEIEAQNISPAVASSLEAGMSETVRNETFATITSVESEPAAVILESEDGNIYEREHPRNMDVALRVELRVRETETGTYFRGEQLGIGKTIVLNFDSVAVEGEITRMS